MDETDETDGCRLVPPEHSDQLHLKHSKHCGDRGYFSSCRSRKLSSYMQSHIGKVSSHHQVLSPACGLVPVTLSSSRQSGRFDRLDWLAIGGTEKLAQAWSRCALGQMGQSVSCAFVHYQAEDC